MLSVFKGVNDQSDQSHHSKIAGKEHIILINSSENLFVGRKSE